VHVHSLVLNGVLARLFVGIPGHATIEMEDCPNALRRVSRGGENPAAKLASLSAANSHSCWSVYRSDGTNEAKHLLELKDPNRPLWCRFGAQIELIPHLFGATNHRAARDPVHLAIFVGCHQAERAAIDLLNCFLIISGYLLGTHQPILMVIEGCWPFRFHT
jgi:hypothetical protein